MKISKKNSTAFLLEEVFQLLLEILDHDPFSQKKDHLSKKHIKRLKELLGQEFSFWLAETGNIYFSTLISAKKHSDALWACDMDNYSRAKEVYDLLLYVSQLIMSIGLRSEQTINTLIKLKELTSNHDSINDDISTVIENTVDFLRDFVCKQLKI